MSTENFTNTFRVPLQIFAMNGMGPSDLLTQRVSGYFTSSQSSVMENRLVEVPDNSCREPSTERPLTESLTRFHQLRKRSDLQLIKCVQQDSSHRQYIMASALSNVTLFFVDPELEKQYRQQAHKPRPYAPQTLASHHFNTYFDILVSALVFTGVTISLFLLYPTTLGWLLLCLASTCWHLLLLGLCLTQLMRGSGETNHSWASNLYSWLTQWRPWHVCGTSLICLPLVAVIVNFSCETTTEDTPNVRFFYYLALVATIHLCNFTQLNCWMKNTLVSVGAVVLLSLIAPPVCPCPLAVLETLSDNTTTTAAATTTATTTATYNASSLVSTSEEAVNHWFHTEVILDTILLLFLVWLLNREFEISYRLSFHSSMLAMKDKKRIQTMKDQADWLLNNIIPRHVVEQIKCTAKYSENHKDVGVMFASIDNFNEFYDESYCGGKEYLRVLNELVGDFDELLDSDEFKNIEKIKTIGSTYMAASGLNPEVRHGNVNPNEHIYELVEFAMAMQRATLSFNEDLIEFDLILRIGINFGDVTAGVIGTTKLYYDIWGDAVNIASRMDTTGVPGYIQVSQVCVPVLQDRYELEPRGQVYVKGKDNMNVFLLKGPRASS
ncbi:adenylyl cyclase 13E [Oratosquilla oratoria]|uniref:adenylyl cyclase 13E n=1 Tax=Oratosquilla oratoria TaxID=337810 RepID=UPI003F765E36